MWTDGKTADRQDMTQLKVAFRSLVNAPKNTCTGICIVYHVNQSRRINHLMTNSGNDCNSYAQKHEIQEQLSTRQKGSCLFHLQKISKPNNHSKMFIVDVPISKKELLTKQDTSDSSVLSLNCQRFVQRQQPFELRHVIKPLTRYRNFRTIAAEISEPLT
jgi:hypothetical protein